MDSTTEIKYYVKPDGNCVVQAITMKNFIFYDGDHVILRRLLLNRKGMKKLGQDQRNRMNGQIICVVRLPEYQEYDPVDLGLNVIARAIYLGSTEPNDSLCVYKDGDKIFYLTGENITKYSRSVAKLVNPNISDKELKLIPSHSVQVFTFIFLHKAGKYGPYIKLRLQWLSNCFEHYLMIQTQSQINMPMHLKVSMQ